MGLGLVDFFKKKKIGKFDKFLKITKLGKKTIDQNKIYGSLTSIMK